MLDAEILSELLEAVADPQLARKRGREIQTLRGVRGVPYGEIARVGAAAWIEYSPTWTDEDEVQALFSTAFEDGLLAIGLLAAMLPDAPSEALDVARDWVERIDDHTTADALGWLVLGPALLASGQPVGRALRTVLSGSHKSARRAAVMAGMALLPEEIEGPSAAPLRARLGSRAVRFVDAPRSADLYELASAALRDEDPAVRKALRRVVGAWAVHDPQAAEAFLESTTGGVPRMIRDAVVKGARKARRNAD